MGKFTKKQILFIIAYHLILLIIVLLFIFKYAEEAIQLKSNIYYYLQTPQADSNIDFTDYPVFSPDEDLWCNDAVLIQHAGGGIDGLDYTNSKEALENTLSNNVRHIEIDFLYTSDNELVCMHSWKEQWGTETAPTLQEFLSGKIYGKFTPMTASDVVQYMEEYPDLYIIIDTKSSEYLKIMSDLVELSSFNTDITDRFIIQLYDSGIKEQILEIYPFSDNNFLFTAYKFRSRLSNKIMNICYDENIFIVTVPYGDWDQETIDLFKSKNITVYEHTVNRPDQANEELQKGVNGFYTDFLSKEDLNIE